MGEYVSAEISILVYLTHCSAPVCLIRKKLDYFLNIMKCVNSFWLSKCFKIWHGNELTIENSSRNSGAAQKTKFYITNFFSKCDQEMADLVTFTKEILNGNLHFLCNRKVLHGLNLLSFDFEHELDDPIRETNLKGLS